MLSANCCNCEGFFYGVLRIFLRKGYLLSQNCAIIAHRKRCVSAGREIYPCTKGEKFRTSSVFLQVSVQSAPFLGFSGDILH